MDMYKVSFTRMIMANGEDEAKDNFYVIANDCAFEADAKLIPSTGEQRSYLAHLQMEDPTGFKDWESKFRWFKKLFEAHFGISVSKEDFENLMSGIELYAESIIADEEEAD